MSAPRRPVLQASGLALRYPGAPAAVFQDVNLALDRGEVVAVLGASGAGKSSLLRVLAGLQPASAGTLLMEGAPLTGVHPRVAVAFQDPSLLPWLSLERNVAFGLDFIHQPVLDAAERRLRIDQAIDEVGLSHARHLRPAQLSGGMAQRTALARCLARQPAVLLLDEPFGALDEVTRGDMQALLRKVVADFHTAAVLITHDIDEALLLADRIVLLGGAPGRILGVWSVDLPQPRADLLPEMGALRLEILTRLRDALRVARGQAAKESIDVP
ncbi:ABC transporter ATP-binding protein [Achromobacter xylosoxidans]|uniref:ABC transporter ATP-binding protein n=1 Tax=Alcaligenes xylosoxydans xylosoxydans TaxID=85698 RepID=UPI0022B8D902|nr:ABC transporter ATP-binding protein [Achromobacter xylosoxidans]MCZ8389706.1 ABC transporter ATP-binding protein [Achromobacter xylosoxidans]